VLSIHLPLRVVRGPPRPRRQRWRWKEFAFGAASRSDGSAQSDEVESPRPREILKLRTACPLTARADPIIDNEIDFAGEVRRLLQADGHVVHRGGPADDPGLVGRFWFSWMQSGMAEVGATRETEAGAWTTALAHRLDNSRIELHRVGSAPMPATMEPYHARRQLS
jgi:hypothetical protein